jgi:hypothetical protein
MQGLTQERLDRKFVSKNILAALTASDCTYIVSLRERGQTSGEKGKDVRAPETDQETEKLEVRMTVSLMIRTQPDLRREKDAGEEDMTAAEAQLTVLKVRYK